MTEQSPAIPLAPHLRYSLGQVAARLSTLGQSLSDSLATELQVAALCCLEAQTRWDEALEFFQNYRLERANLETWVDSEMRYLQAEPAPVEDLSHLRPDAEGRYGWDRWQTAALAAGLSEDLAGLGRAVMREAVQHDWEPRLKLECGWGDAGQAMLAAALADGAAVATRWQQLLDTDGERGHWGPNGEWRSGPVPA